MYTENYSVLFREVNGLKKKRRQCAWIGKLNIVKIVILLKLIYRFNAISTKILSGILKIDKWRLKFI